MNANPANGEEMNNALENMSRQELGRLFPIIIHPYNPQWPEAFRQEKIVLEAAVGTDSIVRLSHIGSTSVPGLDAKPTVDILLEIKQETDLEKLTQSVRTAGYLISAQPENPPPHLMCMKGYTLAGFSSQAFHLHIRYPDDWDELYFRDYLRSHPQTATAYAALKYRLKDQFEFDRDGYTNAKTDFIREVTATARRAAALQRE